MIKRHAERDESLDMPFVLRETKRSACGDCQKQFLGLTEPLLWIQLVAERSPSNQRAFAVAITNLRYNFTEPSTFH